MKNLIVIANNRFFLPVFLKLFYHLLIYALLPFRQPMI